ncbi:transposase [Bradyrhizobium sp. CIR48]|uniref:IS110 family transposase n=1 Tax=Bradyrhizobium sp. CIR48 TaxID=2663840 RepID=UPI0017CCC014|nr:IS110 family transposase [Bradyrhizobium sp. CIR48]MBB4428276.1 transposase [Bradyrhizobium sp. CIR48]
MEETSICVLDQTGGVTFEGCAPTNPEAIAKLLRRHAGNAERIVFETGSLSNWLWHQLKALGFPVLCLDARHAHAALSMRINKSDQNDAKGLAEMARMGWYREAAVKGAESWKTRSMLAARTKLVSLRRDIDNQMRGLCRGLGIVLGKAGSTNLARKVDAVLAEAPDLQDIFTPLLLAQSCLTEQIEKFDRQLMAVAKGDQTVRRMMTVPGVGPLTALSFVVTIDDPSRFKHSADVGAYLGLTPRRYQSGEMDRTGRISMRGNHQMRTYLFEAANVLLTVVRRGSALKRWGSKLAKRIGTKKARLPSLVKWLSSSMPSGPTAPSSKQRCAPHEAVLNRPRSALGGTSVPAGTKVWAISKSSLRALRTALLTSGCHTS